jgi:hypothetical protein
MRIQRGQTLKRRDGGWRAKNLSGAEMSFWTDQRFLLSAENRARKFASSVCQYHRGGGQRFLYPGDEGYENTACTTRLGGRVTYQPRGAGLLRLARLL